MLYITGYIDCFPDEPSNKLFCNFSGGALCGLYFMSASEFMTFTLVENSLFEQSKTGGLATGGGE